MKTLNIGILAHVDAGKTSLTERLLFNAGVITTLGSVDQGNTQTDSMALERQRGITIRAAVTSFTVGSLKLNLIDTPGHPDFIAEVERSLRVLDAVIMVISAVEGIQPQTRVLMRALQRLRVPTLIFVNKIDRMGARDAKLVADMRDKLFPHVIAMNTVRSISTRQVQVFPRDRGAFTQELQTLLADNNEAFLKMLVNDPEKLTLTVCQKELVAQIQQMQVCPVFFGSAIQGVGIQDLTQAFGVYFTPMQVEAQTSLSAVIFKIERGGRGEKIAYLRIYSGELQAHKLVDLYTPEAKTATSTKVTAMQSFQDGKTKDVSIAHAGDIIKVWGLTDGKINDYLGQPPRSNRKPSLARPSLEVVVTPSTASDAPRLYNALQSISEQDPFVEVRQNPRDHTVSVRLCGEVQKEVIEDTLANEYGIKVAFREIKTICIERPVGTGQGVEVGVRGDPYLGKVGLRIEPGPVGSGIQYRLATDVLGTMPQAFFTAIEETVPKALQQGMYGWHVTDCVVTLTHTGFWPRQSHAHANFDKSMSSTAGDFRTMTPLALMQALKQAKTIVYEPMNRFELDIPQAVLAQVMQSLLDVEARLDRPPISSKDTIRLEGVIPARRTFAFERQVPDLTVGEGVFVAELSEYQEARGVPLVRERTDNNPFDRREYLRRILKRD